MILYEYPLNERMRTLLRLEELFCRFDVFFERHHHLDHHACLLTLFEIADIANRFDLKSDLIKELERQRQILLTYRGDPRILTKTLDETLNATVEALNNLSQTPGKPGQHLSNNEWLSSIRSRASIPGGTCKFDLPSYYTWLQSPHEQRRTNIQKWIAPLRPIQEAFNIVLKLARGAGQSLQVTAEQGNYQQTLLNERPYQLVQIELNIELGLIPEASANKYMLYIRFTMQDGYQNKPRSVEKNVPFRLTLCNL